MTSPRLIDRETRTRQKPMRVLVLGMCRTGTSSIKAALRELGYTPHHMGDVLQQPWQIPLWTEAIRRTFITRDQPYEKAEFDKLLAEYDAVTDIPAALFVKELVDAYPEAKVALSTRDYGSWEKSMHNSVWCLLTWPTFRLLRVFGGSSPLSGWLKLAHTIFEAHNRNHYGGPEAKRAFEEHNELVRRTVPKERLLEFEVQEGWEPLCGFLGKDVPKTKFPHLHDGKAAQARLEIFRQRALEYLALRIGLPLFLVVGIIIATIWSRTSAGQAFIADLQVLFDQYVRNPGQSRVKEL